MRIDGVQSIASALGIPPDDEGLEPGSSGRAVAQGTFLVRVPALLGATKGRGKGKVLLRQVLNREPAAVNARLSLTKSYCAGGQHGEAVAIAAQGTPPAGFTDPTDTSILLRSALTPYAFFWPRSGVTSRSRV